MINALSRVLNKVTHSTTSMTKTIEKTAAKVSGDAPKMRAVLQEDVFMRAIPKNLETLSGKDLAKSFNELVKNPFADWQDFLPKNGEKGSTLLKHLLTEYSKPVRKMKSKETEQFVKFVFGESHLPIIQEARVSNKDVAAFVELLEKQTGKALESLIL